MARARRTISAPASQSGHLRRCADGLAGRTVVPAFLADAEAALLSTGVNRQTELMTSTSRSLREHLA